MITLFKYMDEQETYVCLFFMLYSQAKWPNGTTVGTTAHTPFLNLYTEYNILHKHKLSMLSSLKVKDNL